MQIKLSNSTKRSSLCTCESQQSNSTAFPKMLNSMLPHFRAEEKSEMEEEILSVRAQDLSADFGNLLLPVW